MAVEFALVMPFVVLIFLVLIEIGNYLWARNVIDHAARESVRYGIVRGPWGSNWAGTEAAAQTLISNFATEKIDGGGLDMSRASVSTVMDTSNRVLTVSISYRFQPMIVPTSTIPNATLTASSAMDIQRP